MTKHKKIIWLISIFSIACLTFYFALQLDSPARGGKQFGGELQLAIKGGRTALNPLAANTLDHHRIQQLVFEPLLIPAQNQRGWNYLLAKKIAILSDKKTVRISLRKNIRFAPDPCFRLSSDELTAADVAFSLSLACANNKLLEQNAYFAELIVGGKTFYQRRTNPFVQKVKGIRIIDDYQLEIKLTAPYNHFIKLLSSPAFGIMSKVASKYYKADFLKHPVGTGPFQLSEASAAYAMFSANPNYWRQDKHGNQLPYLDKVKVRFETSGSRAQQLFLENKIDLLFDLPVDDLQGAFGTLNDAKSGKNPLHEVYIKNAAKIHFLAFDCTKEPFNNLALRKAFALAVDTKTICEEILKGEGLPLEGYFIPDKNRKKRQQNLESDFQKKLAEAKAAYTLAGYGPSHPLPAINFYVGAAKNTLAYRWANAVAQMLQQNLGIRVLLKNENPPALAKNAIWRSGWIGDYAGAESYLRLFYSRAQAPLLYKNQKVDDLYRSCILAQSKQERIQLEQLLEQVIMQQHAFMPIYSEGFIILNQLHLRGLLLNDVGLLDYAQLYVKEIKIN